MLLSRMFSDVKIPGGIWKLPLGFHHPFLQPRRGDYSPDCCSHPSPMKDRSHLRRFLYRITSRQLNQFAANIFNAVSVARSGGLGAYRSLRQQRPPPGESHCQVRLKDVPHPIHFRPGTADANTIVQNLVRREYGMFRHPIDPVMVRDALAMLEAQGFETDRYRSLYYCYNTRCSPNPRAELSS